MSRMFNEPLEANHVLFKVLDEALRHTDIALRRGKTGSVPEHCGPLHNLALDHRVSVERRRDFDEFIQKRATGLDPISISPSKLCAWADEYSAAANRRSGGPAFLQASNASNEVMPDARRLCSLVKSSHLPELKEVLACSDNDVIEHLAQIATKNPAALKAYLAQAFDLHEHLKADRAAAGNFQPHHEPRWAACADSFRRYAKEDAAFWHGAVGKPVRSSPHRALVAIVEYPATLVGAALLYRPTTLEAGGYAHHCPSPPCRPTSEGGVTMCSQAAIGSDPVPEFIHSEALMRGVMASDETSIMGWGILHYTANMDYPCARCRQLPKLQKLHPGHDNDIQAWWLAV